MILEKLHENVYYYKNVIENPKDLIDAINKTEEDESVREVIPKWDEWSACSGEMYIYGERKNMKPENLKVLSGESLEKANYVVNSIKDGMRRVCEAWKKDKGIEDEVNLSWDVSVNRYMEGTFMGGHYDQQEGDTRLRYSLVMYLNDDYEGGEISFTIKDGVLNVDDKPSPDVLGNGNSKIMDFYIKPEPGSVIIFPSSSPYNHTAHLVKSGYKYMCPAFWMGKEYIPPQE